MSSLELVRVAIDVPTDQAGIGVQVIHEKIMDGRDGLPSMAQVLDGHRHGQLFNLAL